jgi:hypothetical protein
LFVVCLLAGCGQQPAASPSQDRAAAASPAQSTAPQETSGGPPTLNGVYVAHELCPGEGGCPSTRWRAAAVVDVFGAQDTSSPVIAKLNPGDWIDAIEGEERIVPRRGTVRVATQGLNPGEVVYLLQTEGEGSYALWRDGALSSWQWPDDPEEASAVAWDNEAPDAPTLGWWVRVRLASGAIGWVHEPREFECMGPLAGDEHC